MINKQELYYTGCGANKQWSHFPKEEKASGGNDLLMEQLLSKLLPSIETTLPTTNLIYHQPTVTREDP